MKYFKHYWYVSYDLANSFRDASKWSVLIFYWRAHVNLVYDLRVRLYVEQ